MTTPERNKETFARFVQTLNDRRIDAIDEMVASDFVRHCDATPDVRIRSRDEFKAFLRQDMATFPDARQDPRHVLAEVDKLAAVMHLTGTQDGAMGSFPATGKRVSVEFITVLHFADGLISEMWVTWDNLHVMRQLGFV